ncbi:hypothetical protein CC1G_15790 [Coprinopsis cinerea okayama7|uniref:Uncharacterized protein n=1 Tax=Coprinopsis cinerea (strain Okayama-7 / 130 / ATCC MYA-4618 / FGSC 9003) TaxID=240176 RepID=D6RQZ3_COPC7|nr:hypothetical protein CC1G_15790 [Coprinopsis cinerea okayama7\|eukprot:XP_002910070.1 hypothetical protein CC1G_15790 [Coprinopsis cinerea okayama7\
MAPYSIVTKADSVQLSTDTSLHLLHRDILDHLDPSPHPVFPRRIQTPQQRTLTHWLEVM